MTSPVRRPVDDSMSLLNDVMTSTLDQAYAERASRRVTASPPVNRRRRIGPVAVAVLLLLGLVTGVAVADVRGRAQDSTGLRADLVSQAQARAASVDALAGQAQELRVQVDQVRTDALGAGRAGRLAGDQLVVLGLASATTPVQGPGVTVTLDDPPAGEPDVGQAPDLRADAPTTQRVQDVDLQRVVNGLWAAGAEAIAINDHRVSSLTAVRSAGETILVDFQVVTAPYVVQAIGRANAVQVDFVDGPVGRLLESYPERYGITVQVEKQDRLRLPGASVPMLREASPVPGGAS